MELKHESCGRQLLSGGGNWAGAGEEGASAADGVGRLRGGAVVSS